MSEDAHKTQRLVDRAPAGHVAPHAGASTAESSGGRKDPRTHTCRELTKPFQGIRSGECKLITAHTGDERWGADDVISKMAQGSAGEAQDS